jgi:D-3-phosphoglycerate dehydrogenase
VGIEWAVGQYRTPEQALQFAQGSQVLMVQSIRLLLTRPVIEQLLGCRRIVRVGIGYDSVDMAAATEKGIPVCNVPDRCTDDVADHALALLMASIRHIPVLAENAHPFGNPPLIVDNPFGSFGLSGCSLGGWRF